MKNVEFVSVDIDGFMSFSKRRVIKLNVPGLTVIYGRNGAGKSSIPSSLLWCLFGRTLSRGRKPASDHVVNTVTGKCRVLSKLVVNNSPIEVERFRSKTENWLELDGERVFDSDVISAIGFGFDSFMSSYMMAQETAENSFVALDPSESSKVCNRLFRFDELDAAADIMEKEIRAISVQAASTREKSVAARARWESCSQRIEQLTSVFGSAGSIATVVDTSIMDGLIEKCKRAKEDADSRAKAARNDFTRASTKKEIHCRAVDSISRARCCPTCLAEFVDEDSLRGTVSRIMGKVKELDVFLTEVTDRCEKWSAEVGRLESKIDELYTRRTEIARSNKDREVAKRCAAEMASARAELQECIRECRVLKHDLVTIEQLLAEDEFLLKLFSRDLKPVIMSKVLPLLSKAITEVSELLGGEATIVMAPAVSRGRTYIKPSVMTDGGAREYIDHSPGERRRIDLGSMYAMRKVSSELSDVRCNLVVYDDPFSGLDDEGIRLFLRLLGRDKEHSSIVTTPTSCGVEAADRVIHMEKGDGGSEIRTR